MKQHITEEQYLEVGSTILTKIFGDYGYHHDDINIGRMIEFLDIHIIYLENEAGWWGIKTIGILEDIEPVPELCDALWEAVKQVLEKKA